MGLDIQFQRILFRNFIRFLFHFDLISFIGKAGDKDCSLFEAIRRVRVSCQCYQASVECININNQMCVSYRSIL
jgi:hypothetical protein